MKATKGKKASKADKIYAKKAKVTIRKENPFELHVNRDKFNNVLNRKTNHSFGKPLISRQNAFEKRKHTIGAEYKVKNKTNHFEDKRKGGFKKLPKESIYNLNDSEKLTHHGQTLEQIEQFDDILPDEEEMSDQEIHLDANFTKSAHFGGGGIDDKQVDRKTAIEELIADSKKRKAERMKEHEEMLDLTNKLDDNWKELISIVKTMERTETPEKPEPDEYDRLVKEMIFAPRGEPTEKLKSEEELARIEKEKLDNLEILRQLRMKGDDVEQIKTQQYKSADDLDDGYFLDDPVQADDGPAVEAINDDNCLEEEEDKEVCDEDSESGEEEEESEADSLDDLKDDESDSDENCDYEETQASTTKPVTKSDKLVDDNIPFTIALPDEYENFLELLANKSIKNQVTIIERIIKTNHPKLHHYNRSKMIKLFAYILQYMNDVFATDYENSVLSRHFKLVHKLVPVMYDLIQMNPEECSKSFLEVVKEKYEDFTKNPRFYPKLDTLVYFTILNGLFPTSDFRHPIVTPCYIFLHHILSQAKVRNRSDVAKGLFLSTLVYDYQKMSKRLMPAVLNFLKGICYLGVKKSMLENTRPPLPFKKMDELLVLNGESTVEIDNLKPCDLLDTEIDEAFKVHAVYTACCLIKDFVNLYEEIAGVQYIIESFEGIVSRLSDEEKFPQELKVTFKEILDEFERIKAEKKFKYPESEKTALPMLRMLEPRFESVYTDRRQMYCQASGQAAEKKKLQHMLKREKKAAKRELLKDNEFLSKIKHKRKTQMDTERKEKVRRILHEGSIQQGEFKALSRTKGRKGIF